MAENKSYNVIEDTILPDGKHFSPEVKACLRATWPMGIAAIERIESPEKAAEQDEEKKTKDKILSILERIGPISPKEAREMTYDPETLAMMERSLLQQGIEPKISMENIYKAITGLSFIEEASDRSKYIGDIKNILEGKCGLPPLPGNDKNDSRQK